MKKEVTWILATDLKPLSRDNPSLSEEKGVIESIRKNAAKRTRNIVRIMPLKWLEAFNVVDPVEIEKIRQRIIAEVRSEEAKLSSNKALARSSQGFIVDDRYIPKKKERKVFMYASCKETR